MFRDRLGLALADARLSQAALARLVGVDRSTLSQLMAADGKRLPNAQLVAESAVALGVSSDWLLGLSDRRETAANVISATMEMPEAPRALVDETIFAWHREAEGYKIRHVPAGLPDMLKTTDMLMWEAEPSLGRTVAQAVGASRDRLDWMRAGTSDYEIAIPRHELACFAGAQGYYAGLPAALRRAQLDHMARLCSQLYPRLRMYLFDARRLYSAPVTVFGPLLAVVYLGRNYMVFRDSERVRAIGRHVDGLIRDAVVTAEAIPAHLSDLQPGIR